MAEAAEASYSLIGLKPDALERGLADAVYDELEAEGFEIVAEKDVEPTPHDILRKYGHVKDDDDKDHGKDILRGLCNYLVGGEMRFAIVKYEPSEKDAEEEVANTLEKTIGHHPHPKNNPPGSIRGATWHDEDSPFYADEDETIEIDDKGEVPLREQYDTTEGEGRDPNHAVWNIVHFSDDMEELTEDVERYFLEEIKELGYGIGDNSTETQALLGELAGELEEPA